MNSSARTGTSHHWELVSRPSGWPTPENFRLVEVELPALADGEVRVANEFLSVDPYMRGRMNDSRSYVAPFGLGEALTGGAVGRVEPLLAPASHPQHARQGEQRRGQQQPRPGRGRRLRGSGRSRCR